MSIFSATGLIAALNEPQRLSRAEKIHRENERSNLLTISRLVLRSFLKTYMVPYSPTVEGETQQLSDLLMMLEKVLWHGFRNKTSKSLLPLRSPDAEMWLALVRISKTDNAMQETVNCIDQIESLLSPITKIRAFLRLTIMQKKLFDFFTVITNSSLTSDFYEPWALLRQEDAVQLTGALLGLNVVDCELSLEYEHLQEQPLSVDLSLYIRLPTISTEESKPEISQPTNAFEKERKALKEQNLYLEERNRQLQSNLDNLNKRLNSVDSDAKSGSIIFEQEMVSFRGLEDAVDSPRHSTSPPLKNDFSDERERLLAQIVEREDTIRLTQQQLMDTKKLNADLYDKLRLAEDQVQKLEKDFLWQKEIHNQEKSKLNESLSSLVSKNEEAMTKLNSNKQQENTVREELHKKYEQYAQMLVDLEQKQQELAKVTEESTNYKRQMESMEGLVKEVPFLKVEIADLKSQLEIAERRAVDAERALQEVGGQLSESKMRMLELAEELLPLTDAKWEEDANVHDCRGCQEKFTVSRRKHHCRYCGSIFCATCSEGRVKLPSNPKPARVCDTCFSLLKNRQGTNTARKRSVDEQAH
ncbi:hypothetical protein WR25_27274 [Diploscapter pachys]|uniref:FYVE-type domain-containing protein n=1 Tax=Diploscapter pachys TaxID=2018661 RepID=A0A2A2JHJ4_9BILA|nr:hypothetical protein WR25_27274 [Diploscapter pachys]